MDLLLSVPLYGKFSMDRSSEGGAFDGVVPVGDAVAEEKKPNLKTLTKKTHSAPMLPLLSRRNEPLSKDDAPYVDPPNPRNWFRHHKTKYRADGTEVAPSKKTNSKAAGKATGKAAGTRPEPGVPNFLAGAPQSSIEMLAKLERLRRSKSMRLKDMFSSLDLARGTEDIEPGQLADHFGDRHGFALSERHAGLVTAALEYNEHGSLNLWRLDKMMQQAHRRVKQDAQAKRQGSALAAEPAVGGAERGAEEETGGEGEAGGVAEAESSQPDGGDSDDVDVEAVVQSAGRYIYHSACMGRYAAFFSEKDPNGYGAVSSRVFEDCLVGLGMGLSTSKVKLLVAHASTVGTGSVQYAKWIAQFKD